MKKTGTLKERGRSQREMEVVVGGGHAAGGTETGAELVCLPGLSGSPSCRRSVSACFDCVRCASVSLQWARASRRSGQLFKASYF